MSSPDYDYRAAVEGVIEREVGSRAVEVDRSGAFPRDNIDALAGAGLLGSPVRWTSAAGARGCPPPRT